MRQGGHLENPVAGTQANTAPIQVRVWLHLTWAFAFE